MILKFDKLIENFPFAEKTECETKREAAEKLVKQQEAGQSLNLAIVVPSCTAEGDYASLQCHHGSNFCSCWDKEGIPQSQPKKNLTKCSCLIDRAKELKKIPASAATESAEITNCERDGSYTAKQCNRSACWCVNPDTGKKLGNEDKNKSSVKC